MRKGKWELAGSLCLHTLIDHIDQKCDQNFGEGQYGN